MIAALRALRRSCSGVAMTEFAMGAPFLLVAGLIFWMYHVIAHRPGGQPIAALEYAFAKLGKQVVRLLRFGRGRTPVAGEA